MNHIIIVVHSLAVGGAERRISSLANYFASKGHKVTIPLIDNIVVRFELDCAIKVVCVAEDPLPAGYLLEQCSFYSPAEKYKLSFKDKLGVSLSHIAGGKTADFIESELFVKKHSYYLYEYIKQFPEATVVSFMTVPNIALMMAAKKLKNRVLFGDCTDVANEYPAGSPYNALRKKYYGRADAALFQTPAQKDYYTFLPGTKKYVIPNFVKSDGLPSRYEGERRKEIVNFCRLNKAKNLPLLIDAFALFNKDYPDYTLAIYGEGSLKGELLKKISSLGLENKATIYDFDLNVHSKISDAAMFVSSSDREGISNSMLEALAIGLPCVCTDCAGGGARMMIEDHVNGLLVPMRDVNALASAMKEIAADPALAQKLSQNAVKIRQRLEPDKICGEMLSAILGENE
ncbi:MAG: glycosyltransferase [Clostridia bacterium]|nr:glycosyltransferase [Clostridia bacterium]